MCPGFVRSLTCFLFLFLSSFAMTALAVDGGATVVAQRSPQAGGILKVYSNVKGAKVILNGEKIGRTPLIRLLDAGRYRIRLSLDGYEDFEQDIQIFSTKAVTINAQLAKVVGSIEVSANVDGASVFLDEKEVGTTPNAILRDLPAGTYQIQVKKPGFASYSGPITVKPSVRLRLKVELIPNAAVVSVESNPQNATVYLDEKVVGKTPVLLDSVDAGRHSLKVELAGYATHYRAFQVSVGEQLDLQNKLRAEGGSLRVKTKNSGAEVYLEGNLMGRTPLNTEENIQPGQYSLRISRPGYADHIQPVIIEAGRRSKISARLISLDSATSDSAPISRRDTRISQPLTKKWWFWAAVGGVAAATAGGSAAVLISQQGSTTTSTGDIAVTLP